MQNLPFAAATDVAHAAAAAPGFTGSLLYRLHPTVAVDEITLDVRIEENVPAPTEGKKKTSLWRSKDYVFCTFFGFFLLRFFLTNTLF